MDHNSVYSKDRSSRDRVGRADDPSAGVSNNNLRDIVSPLPNQGEQSGSQPTKNTNAPSTIIVPPKIQLSTEEDVKDLNEEEVPCNEKDVEKSMYGIML